MASPTKTVTFLFTDIEGSTRLWEEQPEEMRLALARHDALMRDAIFQHGGEVFKTSGDAFYAAFDNVPSALHAALTAQLALHNEPWELKKPLRVRMALHTGAAEARDNDYFGPPLNRVSRLLAIGHGGQTLLSQTACELARDEVASEISFTELGVHHLRDLTQPELVFQLGHPHLPSDFPPLRSLSHTESPHNLPPQTTSFVGREKEMSETRQLIESAHLLTIAGGGGCGKTRLALQLAADLKERFSDGVWLIEFAPIVDPNHVAQTLAGVLKVREEPGRPLIQTLCDALKTRQIMLIFDNCEHMITACAQLANALLRSCPQMKLLATSREALNIPGEQVYRVPSLSSPSARQFTDAEQLMEFEAVRLFIERATLIRPDFTVNDQNAPALASLCSRLDGIPLALELAAARVRSLSIEEINARLDNLFRLLTGGSRTALPRQQTLHAAIDWSYELLNDQEKAIFRRLAVFAGGWTLEAAEKIGAIDGEIEDWEVLDLLSGLVDKSLVVTTEQEGATRYRLLETVRQYACGRLRESGEEQTVNERHRDHFLALSEEGNKLIRGKDAAFWLNRFEVEHDNLRAAINWSLEDGRKPEAALKMTGNLSHFWYQRGYVSQGREQLARALAQPGVDQSIPERLEAIYWAGWLALIQRDTAQARLLLEETATQARQQGDTLFLAHALNGLGSVEEYHAHNYAAARAHYEEALALNRALPDGGRSLANLNNLGKTTFQMGDYAAAQGYLTETLQICRQKSELEGEALALYLLAHVAHAQEDYAQAETLYEQAQTINRLHGLRQRLLQGLCSQGDLALDRDDPLTARQFYQEASALAQELSDGLRTRWALTGLSDALIRLGERAQGQMRFHQALLLCKEASDQWYLSAALEAATLYYTSEQPQTAARLLGMAYCLRQNQPIAFHPNQKRKQQKLAEPLKAILGEAEFLKDFEDGKSLSLEQAVLLAQHE